LYQQVVSEIAFSFALGVMFMRYFTVSLSLTVKFLNHSSKAEG